MWWTVWREPIFRWQRWAVFVRVNVLWYLNIDVVPVDNTFLDSLKPFFGTTFVFPWRLVWVHRSLVSVLRFEFIQSSQRAWQRKAEWVYRFARALAVEELWFPGSKSMLGMTSPVLQDEDRQCFTYTEVLEEVLEVLKVLLLSRSIWWLSIDMSCWQRRVGYLQLRIL